MRESARNGFVFPRAQAHIMNNVGTFPTNEMRTVSNMDV